MTDQPKASANTSTQLVCVNHPSRPTGLRCSRCNDPICPSCAVLTETGYRCRKCLKAQQKVFTTAKNIDYPLAFIVAGIIALIGSYFASFIGFFAIFIGPIAGVAAAEAVRYVTGRRRGKSLFKVATGGVIAGSIPILLVELFFVVVMLSSGNLSLFGVLGLVWQGLFTFLAASTAYYRMSGIEMRR
jgi:hypothetical protein